MKVSLIALLTSFLVISCDGTNTLELEETLNCIGEYLKNYLPNFGIHLSNPLLIEELFIDLEAVSDDIEGHLFIKNLQIYGLSEAAINIFGGNYDSDSFLLNLYLLMKFEKLTFIGEYETEATYDRTSIRGNGDFWSTLKNVSLVGEFEALINPLDFTSHLPMFMDDFKLYISGLNQKRNYVEDYGDYDYDEDIFINFLLNNQNVDTSEDISMKMSENLTAFVKNEVEANPNIFDETVVPILHLLISALMDSMDSYHQNIIAECFKIVNYVDDYDFSLYE